MKAVTVHILRPWSENSTAFTKIMVQVSEATIT
jgi:hypothetical protein